MEGVLGSRWPLRLDRLIIRLKSRGGRVPPTPGDFQQRTKIKVAFVNYSHESKAIVFKPSPRNQSHSRLLLDDSPTPHLCFCYHCACIHVPRQMCTLTHFCFVSQSFAQCLKEFPKSLKVSARHRVCRYGL